MIRVSPWTKGGGGWEVDIRTRGPAGERIRLRVKSPAKSPSGSLRWAEGRERELIEYGRDPLAELGEGGVACEPQEIQVPTLAAFAGKFITDYAVANRNKPSEIETKKSILKNHLIPALGALRLDQIGPAEMHKVKVATQGLAPKTTNNVLTVLHTMLSVAVKWGVIEGPPCSAELIRYQRGEKSFWDFEELERLIAAAADLGEREHLIVLLASKAGLRCGEIMALSWTDVDLPRRRVCVRASEWKGHVTGTKGGRVRIVPLAAPLRLALIAHRHLRSDRVLAQASGKPLTSDMVRGAVQRAEHRASLRALGVHALRHTFCSHLAMRGVPARAIQELAGHANLCTTMGYMHLSPAAIESAIRTLDFGTERGEIGERASRQDVK